MSTTAAGTGRRGEAGRSSVRRSRRGMTVLEVLVAIAILLAVVAAAAPALSAILSLEQRRVARDLALSYERLHDEAILRNVTFRFAYHVDGNYYEIEVGDPHTLIFDDPEKRVEYEEARADRLARYDDEELAEAQAAEPRFETLTVWHKRRVDLPHGTVFGGVYTPQYEDMVRPSGLGEEDPDEPLIVYSYLFANGYAEPTIVQLVEADDPEEGFTLIVEPLTGRVRLEPELIDEHDLYRDVPGYPPDLP